MATSTIFWLFVGLGFVLAGLGLLEEILAERDRSHQHQKRR